MTSMCIYFFFRPIFLFFTKVRKNFAWTLLLAYQFEVKKAIVSYACHKVNVAQNWKFCDLPFLEYSLQIGSLYGLPLQCSGTFLVRALCCLITLTFRPQLHDVLETPSVLGFRVRGMDETDKCNA